MKRIIKNHPMKLFINRTLVTVVLGIAWAAGCSDQKELPTPAPKPVEAAPQAASPVAQQPAPVQPAKEKATVTPPVTSTPAQTEAVQRLKAWDKKLLSLTTSFTQTTEYDGVLVSRSHGKLSYDKAHQLLRLDTMGADEQIEQSAITNKQDIIILDAAGNTVTTLSWQQWQQGQPNQALFDFGNYTSLLEKHHVKLVRPNLLALTPKEGEPYTLYVSVAQQDFFPTELTIESGSLLTRAQLTDTHKNKPLDLSIFGGFSK